MIEIGLAALGGAVVGALIVYRWVHADGYAAGYDDRAVGARALSEPPSPDLSGGPRERP